MDDLASELNISKKTIYKYFSTKELLITEIIDTMFAVIKEKEHQLYLHPTFTDLERLIEILSVYPDYEKFNCFYIPDVKATYPDLYLKIETHLDSNWDEAFTLLDKCIDQQQVKNISHFDFKIIFLGLYKQLLLILHENPEAKMRQCIGYIFEGLIK